MAAKANEKNLIAAGQELAKALAALAHDSPSFAAAKEKLRGDGECFIRQTARNEVKAFDDSFIVEMEEGVEAISRIIANPRTFIKEQAEIVEAGLAKKISARSVSHLASHAQFVRSVDEDSNVHPDKILTIFSETDAHIYENRFIMTLIRRCLVFLQERYNFILEHGETYDSDLLLVHDKVEIDGLTYTIDTRIKVSTPSTDAGESKRNSELIARMTQIREKLAYFLRSPFMQEMKGAKEVSSPIHMTNMLLKQPDYHRAYLLWNFLDGYESLGISFDVTETNQRFDKDYFDRIYNLLTASMLTLASSRVKNRVIPDPTNTESRHVEPTVTFTLEDESYQDGRFIYNHFPEQRQNRPDPLALLPEEAAAERQVIEEAIAAQRKAKPAIEADILADKDALVLALAKARAAARRQALIDHPEYDESNKPEPVKEETPETEEDLEHARAEARRQGEEDRARDRTKDQ